MTSEQIEWPRCVPRSIDTQAMMTTAITKTSQTYCQTLVPQTCQLPATSLYVSSCRRTEYAYQNTRSNIWLPDWLNGSNCELVPMTDRSERHKRAQWKRSFISLWQAGSDGLDAAVLIGPLSSWFLYCFWAGTHWGTLTASCGAPLMIICVCSQWTMWVCCFRRLIAAWRPLLRLNALAFQMSDDGGRRRRPSTKPFVFWENRMKERKRGRGERKGRWWLHSIINLAFSTKQKIRRHASFTDWSLRSGKVASTIHLFSLPISFFLFSHITAFHCRQFPSEILRTWANCHKKLYCSAC